MGAKSFSVKCILFLLLILGINSATAIAQDSVDEYTGLWTDNTSWVGGVIPDNTSTTGTTININGFITLEGSLVFENDVDMYVKSGDSLVIKGDFTMKNNCNVYVETGALFVVLGNYTAKNNLFTSNEGTIVVDGDITTQNGATTTNNGDFYTNDPNANAELGLTGAESTQTIDKLNNNGDSGDQSLYDFINSGGSTTLPVELAYFEGAVTDKNIQLNWATLTEINFDYFEIFHSDNGLQFEKVGQVKGNGNSNEKVEYEFLHDAPNNGKNYYLLQAVDIDGTIEKHGIIVVYLNGELEKVKVYPNPLVDQNLYLNNLDLEKGDVKVILMHASGQVVMKTKLTPSNVRNIKVPADLSKGLYLVTIEQNGQKVIRHIIVQ